MLHDRYDTDTSQDGVEIVRAEAEVIVVCGRRRVSFKEGYPDGTGAIRTYEKLTLKLALCLLEDG
jgi:hypothetical protein